MGTRLGTQGPKALVELAGRPLLVRTLQRFVSIGLVDDAVIVIPPSYADAFRSALHAAFPDHAFSLVPGGAERQQSVENGLAALRESTDIAVVHDAARPFVAPESVQSGIEAAGEYGAATVAIPSVDTILQADDDACLEATPDRAHLWACQTPQIFRVDVIRAAHSQARAEGFAATDDATLVRRTGGTVKLVPGTAYNIKLTTPGDFAIAQAIINEGLA
jgi:2-C-methyl-D-erythritol 4-phosphate cytidylyltransferase